MAENNNNKKNGLQILGCLEKFNKFITLEQNLEKYSKKHQSYSCLVLILLLRKIELHHTFPII